MTETIFLHTEKKAWKTNKQTKENEREKYLPIDKPSPLLFLCLCVKLKKVEKRENKARSMRRKKV